MVPLKSLIWACSGCGHCLRRPLAEVAGWLMPAMEEVTVLVCCSRGPWHEPVPWFGSVLRRSLTQACSFGSSSLVLAPMEVTTQNFSGRSCWLKIVLADVPVLGLLPPRSLVWAKSHRGLFIKLS